MPPLAPSKGGPTARAPFGHPPSLLLLLASSIFAVLLFFAISNPNLPQQQFHFTWQLKGLALVSDADSQVGQLGQERDTDRLTPGCKCSLEGGTEEPNEDLQQQGPQVTSSSSTGGDSEEHLGAEVDASGDDRRALEGQGEGEVQVLIRPSGKWVQRRRDGSWYWRSAEMSRFQREQGPKCDAAHAQKVFGGKWLYFWGDSTMRLAFLATLNALQCTSLGLLDSKRMVRSGPAQRGRKPYRPLPLDGTPCHRNERTFHMSVSGNDTSSRGETGGESSIEITFGWKHLIYEDFDHFFFEQELPLLLAERGRLPDVLIIGTGVHNSYHYGESRMWQDQRDFDSLLALVAAPRNYTMPPIIWLDNVPFIRKPFNPNVILGFNKYFRAAVIENLMAGKHKGVLLSREGITMTSPEMFWGGERMHLDLEVQDVIARFLFIAIEQLVPF